MGHHDHSGRAALDAIVSDLVETRRQIAVLQAHEMRVLARGVDLAVERMEAGGLLRRASERDLPLREIAAELGAAMRLSDRAVQTRMGTAASLVTRFPATLKAWEAGLIDAGHVSAIVDPGAPIGDEKTRATYEQRVLEIAGTQSPSRLRPLARAVAARLEPDAETVRMECARDARSVRVLDLDDGLARLIADGPAPLVYAIHDRLTRMGRAVLAASVPDAAEAAAAPAARPADEADPDNRVVVTTGPTATEASTQRGPGAGSVADTRTLDQVRADVFADLLLAGAPAAHGDGDGLAAIAGHVQITVPALSLLGVEADPALLAGYGPVDTETARRLTANAPGWTRVLTDPMSGVPVVVDRYRPSKKQKRYLEARDEHCRFPGCRVPVRRCDVDHTVDAARGGPTSIGNLAHFCRRHHVVKHSTAWTVRQRGGGVIEWTSPTGRTYADRPPSAVRFVPDSAAPPGAPPPF